MLSGFVAWCIGFQRARFQGSHNFFVCSCWTIRGSLPRRLGCPLSPSRPVRQGRLDLLCGKISTRARFPASRILLHGFVAWRMGFQRSRFWDAQNFLVCSCRTIPMGSSMPTGAARPALGKISIGARFPALGILLHGSVTWCMGPQRARFWDAQFFFVCSCWTICGSLRSVMRGRRLPRGPSASSFLLRRQDSGRDDNGGARAMVPTTG